MSKSQFDATFIVIFALFPVCYALHELTFGQVYTLLLMQTSF